MRIENLELSGMRWSGFCGAVLCVLVTGCVTSGTPEGNGPRMALTERDGVDAPRGLYTDEQARRGERTARNRCFGCHTAGEWSGVAFVNPSSARDVEDLHRVMRSSMPPSDPGGLRNDEYADVLAYILSLRGVPQGALELPHDSDHLRAMLQEVLGGR